MKGRSVYLPFPIFWGLCFLLLPVGEVSANQPSSGDKLDGGTKWILTPNDGSPELHITIEEENGQNFFMLGGKKFVYHSESGRYVADDGSGEYYQFDRQGHKYVHGWQNTPAPEGGGTLTQEFDPI